MKPGVLHKGACYLRLLTGGHTLRCKKIHRKEIIFPAGENRQLFYFRDGIKASVQLREHKQRAQFED